MIEELQKHFNLKNSFILERNNNFLYKGVEAIRDDKRYKRIKINDALFILNEKNYHSFDINTIKDKEIYNDTLFLLNNGAKFTIDKLSFNLSTNEEIAKYFKENLYNDYIKKLENEIKSCFKIENVKIEENWSKGKITFTLPEKITFIYENYLRLQYFCFDYIHQKEHMYIDKKRACITKLNSNLKFYINYDSVKKIQKELVNIMSKRIRLYSGEKLENDISPTKGETNQEKAYQQLLLTELCNNKDYVLKNCKNIFSNKVIPLCMELVVYVNDKKVKGRIDDVVIDGDTCILVEIKYGTGVIGGTNGIHKHLLDLYTYLKNNSRAKLLELVEEKYKEINDEEIKLNNLKYYILCGYNNKKSKLSISKVKGKIDEIYNEKLTSKKIITNNVNGNKSYTDFKNYLKEKYTECPDLNVKEYIELINKNFECPTEIWLTDEKYEQFDEYNSPQ